MFLMVNVFYRVGAGSARPNTSTYVLWVHSGRQTLPLRLIAAIPCPRCGEAFAACNSVPTLWGSFRGLRFRAHTVGKLSRLAIPCPHRGEAFAACDFVPTLWGSFRGLRFRARAVGKLSQLAIPCPRCGEAFAATCHGALKRLTSGYVSLGGFTALGKSPSLMIVNLASRAYHIAVFNTGGSDEPSACTYLQFMSWMANASFILSIAAAQLSSTFVVSAVPTWSSPMPRSANSRRRRCRKPHYIPTRRLREQSQTPCPWRDNRR